MTLLCLLWLPKTGAAGAVVHATVACGKAVKSQSCTSQSMRSTVLRKIETISAVVKDNKQESNSSTSSGMEGTSSSGCSISDTTSGSERKCRGMREVSSEVHIEAKTPDSSDIRGISGSSVSRDEKNTVLLILVAVQCFCLMAANTLTYYVLKGIHDWTGECNDQIVLTVQPTIHCYFTP